MTNPNLRQLQLQVICWQECENSGNVMKQWNMNTSETVFLVLHVCSRRQCACATHAMHWAALASPLPPPGTAHARPTGGPLALPITASRRTDACLRGVWRGAAPRAARANSRAARPFRVKLIRRLPGIWRKSVACSTSRKANSVGRDGRAYVMTH